MGTKIVRYVGGFTATLVIVLGLPTAAHAATLVACISDATVTETNVGVVNASFTIDTCSENTPGTMTATYTTANGSAAAPGDYTAKSGTISFSRSAPATVNVVVAGDALDEDDELFLVNLSNPVNGTIRQGTGVGTIVDNDSPPSVSVNDISINEATGVTSTGNFSVSLSAASGRVVTVQYATSSGSAIAPGDYGAASGTLSFAPGDTTKPIPIVVQGDPTDENNETFTITLSSPSNVTLGDATGIGTIVDDDGFPALSINDVSVTEGNAGTVNANFTVTLSPASGKTVTVNYATANGTAGQPGDYTSTSGTHTFTPGQVTKTVTVVVKGDTVDEADETLQVNLSGASSANVTDAQGIGTITDDDPVPNITVTDVGVTEADAGTQNATFTVSLSAASGRSVSVDYATINGTAAQPGDYTATSGTLTFDPGESTKTVDVPVRGELDTELTETFSLSLSSAVNATIADATGVGTITDNDPDPTISVGDVTVNEGNVGTTNAAFTVQLIAASYKTITIDYATAPGTAGAPGDFTPTSGSITFVPGETVNTVLVPVVGDTLDEPDETFDLVLSNPSNTSVVGGNGVATIADEDASPTLSIDDVTVGEGDAGTTPTNFTVSLSAPSGRDVTVEFVTVEGDATASTDYAVSSGTLTLLAGDTSETATVNVSGDTLNEIDEVFHVQLSNPNHATVADGNGDGTITNDDPVPTVDVGDAAITEGDSGTDGATFTVTLSAASGRNVRVGYATADGTAVQPDDYDATSGELTFSPGETTKTVTVPVKGETAAELTETFVLDLSVPNNHADIGDGQGVATITDNDPDPTMSIDDVTIVEGDAGTSSATFTVSLSAFTFKTVTVDYATVDGTAAAPDDYAATNDTLTFAPGETTQQVTVDVVGDSDSEVDEAFTVELSNADNASMADGSGTGQITDDDAEPTSLTVSAKKVKRKIVASGTLVNAEVGMSVTVKMQKKKGRMYVRGVSRSPVIRAVTDANSDGIFEGSYAIKFRQPAKGSYRFLATFAGDETHLASTAIKRFRV
jgi:chitinase